MPRSLIAAIIIVGIVGALAALAASVLIPQYSSRKCYWEPIACERGVVMFKLYVPNCAPQRIGRQGACDATAREADCYIFEADPCHLREEYTLVTTTLLVTACVSFVAMLAIGYRLARGRRTAIRAPIAESPHETKKETAALEL